MSLVRSLVASHEPTEGKLREVYIARRYKGQQEAPVDQVLNADGGYQTTVTVSAATAGSHSIVINGETVTVTAASDTVATLRDKFVAAINERATILQTGVYAGDVGTGTFKLVSPSSFTVTESDDDITVATVAFVAGGAVKDATTFDLFEPLKGRMEAGQYLCFVDGDDFERILLLTATAQVGATSLTIAPLKQDIPAGSRAEFPCYLWDRTGANVSRSYSNNQTTTFNTGNARDGVATGNEKNITLPGLYYGRNAAYLTAKKAADDGAYVHVRVLAPPLDETGDFDYWIEVEGRGLVTSANSEAPQDGNKSGDLEIAFMGTVYEGDPYTS